MTESTLLLVDDEPNILHALNRLLRREGYKILMAQSGSDALQLLQGHPVDVLLTDQRMPVMSGTELLAQVKQQYPHIVRMMLSGWLDTTMLMDAVNVGHIYKFIAKPWDDEELRLLVKEAFDYRAQQPALIKRIGD
jgi:response regulator RpfG family c-di-GMP phosphodiesterase